jgi:hypothetical protein
MEGKLKMEGARKWIRLGLGIVEALLDARSVRQLSGRSSSQPDDLVATFQLAPTTVFKDSGQGVTLNIPGAKPGDHVLVVCTNDLFAGSLTLGVASVTDADGDISVILQNRTDADLVIASTLEFNCRVIPWVAPEA